MAVDGEATADQLRDGVEIQFPIPGGAPRSARMVPYLLIARDDQSEQTAPCPPELVDAAIEEMKASVGALGAKAERLQKK
jgi:hypothetical protein